MFVERESDIPVTQKVERAISTQQKAKTATTINDKLAFFGNTKQVLQSSLWHHVGKPVV